ncbi:hypothetical protein GYMLUDRAFT_177233 [Collybiopsis luxurians FD-317 M1]|uniref:3-keto sterol reductase n=1 Tax=Collybiopsis luxurians FD-317 M1 TaxID=944289 RepID=A0A0D0BX70_9AGAR|nr:hypothetical protein GYMLUDRAFT_177233 [Collybiopsis luxurians FD-317 M1]
MSWPIIVVTGANGGVGFGICQRLLCQLSEKTPSDTLLRPKQLPENRQNDSQTRDADQFVLPCEGITLIMACRSVQRAKDAREKLLKILDEHIEKLRERPQYDGHADSFRRNVKIEIHQVDLAALASIPKFVKEVQNKYPYVSHLICNAGIAPFAAIDWPKCFHQLFTAPLSALTTPRYYKQIWGEVSQDGYGFVWQCNMFGHYILYRDLYPLLSSPKYPHDSRVVWTSSLEAQKKYEAGDWQLVKTRDVYGSSKYQTELVSLELDRRALDDPDAPEENKRVRHFTAHPGVTHTNIAQNLISPLMQPLKVVLFYVARWLGSPDHPIAVEKGAISVVWVSIISLSVLSIFSSSSKSPQNANGTSKDGSKTHPTVRRPAVKFSAQTDWWGNSRVGMAEIESGEEHSAEAKELVDYCEDLYQEIKAARI